MAHTKAQLKKAAQVGAQLAPELLTLAADLHAQAKVRAEQEARRRAREEEANRLEAAIEAETQAFSEAGLQSGTPTDARGQVYMPLCDQSVTLINTRAHPSALVGTALARCQRLSAVTRILEQSSLVSGDSDLVDASYTIARMAEDVSEILHVLLAHRSIIDAPFVARQ